MNNELACKWTLAPKAGDDAMGAALRRALPCGCETLPQEIRELVSRLERRGGAQAAMS